MANIYTNYKIWLRGLLGAHDSSTENVRDQVDGMFETTVCFVKAAADAMASTTTASTPFWVAPRDCQVVSAKFISVTATVTDPSDIATIILNKQDGAGGSDVVVASKATSVVGVVANVPFTLTNTTTAADLQLSAGNILCWQVTKGASGKIVGIGNLIVTVREM